MKFHGVRRPSKRGLGIDHDEIRTIAIAGFGTLVPLIWILNRHDLHGDMIGAVVVLFAYRKISGPSRVGAQEARVGLGPRASQK